MTLRDLRVGENLLNGARFVIPKLSRGGLNVFKLATQENVGIQPPLAASTAVMALRHLTDRVCVW